jgi:hypothetical protein
MVDILSPCVKFGLYTTLQLVNINPFNFERKNKIKNQRPVTSYALVTGNGHVMYYSGNHMRARYVMDG